MDRSVADFLQSEYDTAWAHIRDIDNRRLTFVEFYTSLNAVLATAITAIITRDKGSVFTFGNFTLVLIGGIVISAAGLTILGMLRSERQANIRFRRRVNYIRGFFLQDSTNDKIKKYLENYMELNTPTDRTENLLPRGSTLKWAYRLIIGGFFAWGAMSLTMLILAIVKLLQNSLVPLQLQPHPCHVRARTGGKLRS